MNAACEICTDTRFITLHFYQLNSGIRVSDVGGKNVMIFYLPSLKLDGKIAVKDR